MGEWGWFGVTAAAIASLLFVLMTRGRGARSQLREPEEDAGEGSSALTLGGASETLSRGLPGEQRDREDVLPELLRAGMYGRTALAEYRALRAILFLAPLFATAALCLIVAPPLLPSVATVGLMVSAVGFALPRVYVAMKAQARMREIERGLPVFADMVSIALLAGQGLIVSLNRVAAQLRPSFPRLADELVLVVRQTELYNLSLAVEQWANRSQSPDVRNLALILAQAEKLGTDISGGLMEYATNMRTGAKQRLEARAQRATFWMLFPTIFCLWIPAAVILVAPILTEFAARRTKAKEQMPSLPESGKIGKILGAPPAGK